MHTAGTPRLRLADGIALGGLLVLLALLIARYPDAPARIPIHFGLRGEANGYGSRAWLWFPPLFGVLVWAGLYAVRHASRFFNLPASPGSAARLRQEEVAAQFLAVLGAVLMWLCVCFELMELGNARGAMSPLTLWIAPLVLVATLTPVVWFALRLRATREG